MEITLLNGSYIFDVFKYWCLHTDISVVQQVCYDGLMRVHCSPAVITTVQRYVDNIYLAPALGYNK